MKRDQAMKSRRGYAVYARMMGALMQAPMCTSDLAAAHGLIRSSAADVMRYLNTREIVHVSGWVRTPGRGNASQEVWALGPGRNEPRPPTVRGSLSRRAAPRRKAFRPLLFVFSQIMHALLEGHTSASITELTGMDRRHVDGLVRFMRDELQMLYVVDWYRNDFGSPSPVHRIGRKTDARRPRPLGRRVDPHKQTARRNEWASMLRMTAAPLAVAA